MIGDGNRPGSLSFMPLHDDMATSPSDLGEAMPPEDATDLAA
jgi:hypothetical protein